MDNRNLKEIYEELNRQTNGLIRYFPLIIVIVVILVGIVGAVYSIGPDEVGVVQRFGKYIETTTPGLHSKIPFGVDKVTPVKVKHIYKQEFGVRTLEAGIRTTYSDASFADESLMLTGDLNILDVRWIVQFKIKNPVDFLFDTRYPVTSLRDIAEVSMRRLVGIILSMRF